MMDNFEKLLGRLGFNQAAIHFIETSSHQNNDRIVEVNSLGFEETSEEMMQRDTTTRYWCCVYDKNGNIVVDASFDKDISEDDARLIQEAYQQYT